MVDIVYLEKQYTRGGIRTHEAEAIDLKSTPFDRSGTLAIVAIRSSFLVSMYDILSIAHLL